MSVIPKNVYQNDYSLDVTNTFGLAAVQADAGDIILHTVQYRDAGSNNVSTPPVWGGETFTSCGARANGYMWTQTWKLIVTTTGTHDIVQPTDGVDQYFPGMAFARVYSGAVAVASLVQEALANDTYVAPSLVSSSLSAGDLIDEVLNSSGFSTGLGFENTMSAIWAEANEQTRQEEYSGVQSFGNLIYSTKTGTGALTVGYTTTGFSPAYVHSVLVLIAGSSSTPTVDTLGQDGKVRIGSSNAVTTTNIATITTDSTIDGVAISSASAVDGDGTITPAGFVDGEISYSAMGTTVDCAISDGDVTATVTRELDTFDGWQWKTISGFNTESVPLGLVFTGVDIPTQIHLPDDGVGILNEDGSLTDWPLGTTVGWARMPEGTWPEGTMKQFSFTANGGTGGSGGTSETIATDSNFGTIQFSVISI